MNKDQEELHNRRVEDQIFLKADTKYAVKLVERIVYGMVTVILLGALGALLNLIYRTPKP